MNDALLFAAQLPTHEPCRAHAIVVLCGEDCRPRIHRAVQLFKSGAAPVILLSGGKDEAPRWMGAESARKELLTEGIAPDRILIESASQNTREQAENVIAYALEQGWTHLLLVASAYHQWRAFLTFVQAVSEANAFDMLRLIPCPAPASWRGCPDGMHITRSELQGLEIFKIETYQGMGHAASYLEGIAYLQQWEREAFAEAA